MREQFELVDDGTMDTVVKCTLCGCEERFNFDGDADDDRADGRAYDAFVEGCFDDMDSEHICEREEVAEYRWVVRAMTPGGLPWVVGQAWSYDGVLGLIERVPMSDAVRVERWLGNVRLTEGN